MKREQITQHSDGTVSVVLSYVIFQEGDAFVAYCPSLKISTYGDSMEDTKEAAQDLIRSTITDWTEEKRIERELLHLGWNLQYLPTPIFRQPERIVQEMYQPRIKSVEQFPMQLAIH